MKKVDVIGKMFGQLTVLSEAEPRKSGARNVRFMHVKCTCGTQMEVGLNPLRMGKVASCGCLRRQVTGDMARTHGDSTTKLYKVWKNMRSRCNNKRNSSYPYYGGRGITVCSTWNEFPEFKAWALASGYSENLIIERVEVNGNYQPDNCTWATRKQQANNRNTRGYLK